MTFTTDLVLQYARGLNARRDDPQWITISQYRVEDGYTEQEILDLFTRIRAAHTGSGWRFRTVRRITTSEVISATTSEDITG